MSNSDITLSREDAYDAYVALKQELERTDGGDTYNEPLAEAINRIRNSDQITNETTRHHILAILHTIANERNVAINDDIPGAPNTTRRLASKLGRDKPDASHPDQTTLQ